MQAPWFCWILSTALLGGCDSNHARAGKSDTRADQVATTSDAAPAELTRSVIIEQIEPLTRQLPGSLGVLMLEFTPAKARLQAESPATRGAVLQYEWRSKELGPGVSVELRGKGQLGQNLFALSSIDFAALPGVLETARARVDAENGRVSRVLIRRNLPQDESVGIRVYVDSPRRSGHFDADAHGRAVEPGRYP